MQSLQIKQIQEPLYYQWNGRQFIFYNDIEMVPDEQVPYLGQPVQGVKRHSARKKRGQLCGMPIRGILRGQGRRKGQLIWFVEDELTRKLYQVLGALPLNGSENLVERWKKEWPEADNRYKGREWNERMLPSRKA